MAFVQDNVEADVCHLILVLPVVGLAAFWLWPLPIAVPAYVFIFFISLLFYYLIIQAMRRPVMTGAEEILQGTGKVIEVHGHKIRIRVHSEIWNAESPDKLCAGDQVRIVGVDGLVLSVRRVEPANGIVPFNSTAAGPGMLHRNC